MQSPSLPPQIPKHSLAPVWIGALVALVIGGLAWALFLRPPRDTAQAEPAAADAPVAAATPARGAAEPSAEPPPPPPPFEPARPAPARVGAIPPDVALAPAASPAPATAGAPRDPNCADPCKGRETADLLTALRTKAVQARSCYERALVTNSSLSGKLEVALRVGASGSACSASVANDTLKDASLERCALARFRSGNYPKPIGGCVDVSVPMNFMPAGTR